VADTKVKEGATLTLKRIVTIKVIVTEQFKNYLTSELERTIRNLQIQMQQVDAYSTQYVTDLESKNMTQQVTTFKQQLAAEKQRQELSVQEIQKRIEEARKLPLNSEFIQGTVDGFVQVKKGDNLYEKLGAMEITIKDGVVQHIGNYVPPQPPKPAVPGTPPAGNR
jgi:hypothetical protein